MPQKHPAGDPQNGICPWVSLSRDCEVLHYLRLSFKRFFSAFES